MTELETEPTPQSVMALAERVLGDDARKTIPPWAADSSSLATALGEDCLDGYFAEKYAVTQKPGFSSYDREFKQMLARELDAEVRLVYLIDKYLRAAGIDPASL